MCVSCVCDIYKLQGPDIRIYICGTSSPGIPGFYILPETVQELYEDERAVLEDMQTLLAEDWGKLAHVGVEIDGCRVYPILLGLKADWSYHVP